MCKTCNKLSSLYTGRIENTAPLDEMLKEERLREVGQYVLAFNCWHNSLYQCTGCGSFWIVAIADKYFRGYLLNVTSSVQHGTGAFGTNDRLNVEKVSMLVGDFPQP